MIHHSGDTGHAHGFTLAEVLVALALLSILTGMVYSFYLFTHKQVVVREKKAFEFDDALALLESIAKNIRQSRATLSLEPSQWRFLTRSNDTAVYVYAGDTLYFNSMPLNAGGRPVTSFSFTCFGQDSAHGAERGSELSFSQIDQNNDGVISGSETGAIARIRAAIGVRDTAGETLAVVETIKNKLHDDTTGYTTYFK